MVGVLKAIAWQEAGLQLQKYMCTLAHTPAAMLSTSDPSIAAQEHLRQMRHVVPGEFLKVLCAYVQVDGGRMTEIRHTMPAARASYHTKRLLWRAKDEAIHCDEVLHTEQPWQQSAEDRESVGRLSNNTLSHLFLVVELC